MKRLLVALVVWTLGATSASAGIISTAGNFQVVDPGTANYTAAPFNDPIPAPTRIWQEQADFNLVAGLVMDTDLSDPTQQYVTGSPGPGQVAFGPGGVALLAGAHVDVYYAYFDPAGTQNGLGSVTFNAPVIGIIAFTRTLAGSDFLRVPGAPYPVNPLFANRGWEDTEWGQLSADRLTLTFSALASNPGDQFRIITEVGPTVAPEPASSLLLVLGLAGVAARRRNRRV